MWKLGSWQMSENAFKESDHKVRNAFVCSRRRKIMEEIVNSIEKLGEEPTTVNGFCYLGDILNAIGGFEAAVTAIVRIL